MSNIPERSQALEPTFTPLLETAKGLMLGVMSGLPYEISLENPDKDTYFTFNKDGLSYGAMFMDNKLADPLMYGLTDAMLLSMIHHRYSEMAKVNPELAKAVASLENALQEVHANEVRLIAETADAATAAATAAQQQAEADAAAQ